MCNTNLNNIIDISRTKKELILKNQNKFFIIDNEPQNTDQKIKIIIDSNKQINVFLYILCNSKNKQYSLICKHNPSSQCNIFIKALVNNAGQVKINVKNIVDKNINNVKINQDIQGLTFDDNSKIIITPSMLIDNNKIIANHSVSIGNLNPDAIFYLMSRGLSKNQATTKLIESMFNDLYIEDSKKHVDVYNKTLLQVNKLIKR
jgi:Fe-S cluster assembly scaffold protein SufB